jgi:hypothetical protein
MRHVCLGQPEMSAVAEHRFETGHNININSISNLDKATGYMDCMIKEATEIKLHSRNFNKNGGFTLRGSWYPMTNTLKQCRDTPIWKQG